MPSHGMVFYYIKTGQVGDRPILLDDQELNVPFGNRTACQLANVWNLEDATTSC